jgi:DnaJ family protein A protein 2
VVLKHLDGRGIQLTHPVGEILESGQTLKIPGEGMPHRKGEGRGDLYLNVLIKFPEKGWKPNVDAIRKVLPNPKPEVIVAEPIDELDYIRNASLEEVSGSLLSRVFKWIF